MKKIIKDLGWLSLWGTCCGLFCGGPCVLFMWLTTACDDIFHKYNMLIYALPLTGLIISFLYDDFRKKDELNVDALFRHAREEKQISLWIVPLISASTCLAYLTGGSVGRVGSAFQIGGGIAVFIQRRTAHIRQKAPPAEMLIACGFSAGFCGILGTPLAGALFGVEVLLLYGKKLRYLVPASITSYTTYAIAKLFRVEYVDFRTDFIVGVTDPGCLSGEKAMSSLTETGITAEVLMKVIAVSVAAMMIGRLFCWSRRITIKAFSIIKYCRMRVLAGTIMVVAFTQISGNTDCNGIGFEYIEQALCGSSAMTAAFWKLLLTVTTLGCGIRGGEVAPVIFLGATGCYAVGCIIGLNPALSAAIGIDGALASVTNCPITILAYALEGICFSRNSLICFSIAACIAHFLSGTKGLYKEQHAEKQMLKPKLF